MTDFVMWYTTDEFQGRFHYPSMHQDLIQNHRKTEIDYLNGYVSRKGKEYGINTPYCDTVTIIIHGRENMLVKYFIIYYFNLVFWGKSLKNC